MNKKIALFFQISLWTLFLMSYNATSPHDKDAMIIVTCHDHN